MQSDPSLPAALLDLAQPIAQAMGALHQIERSHGAALTPHAENALNHVRTALSQLQTHGNGHPAADQAMEAVAGSLGHVHSLHKLTMGPAPVAAAPAAAAAPAPRLTPPRPQPAVAAAPANPNLNATATMEPQRIPPAEPHPHPVAPAAVYPQVQPQPQYQPAPAPQPQPQYHAPPAPQPQPQYQAPPAPVPQAPAPQAPAPQPPHASVHQTAPSFQAVADPFARRHSPPPEAPHAPGGAPQRASVPVPSPPAAGGATVVEAALGAHSATNFYKGLSGNDIIDHGGLFVATYMVPKIGSTVRLKVSLPGGYEFEANALVKWARESSSDGDSAQPGFGAKLTEISPEARQLVYRYVRNREPLFHDDF